MKRMPIWIIAAGFTAAVAGILAAQEKGADTKSERPEDEKAIRDAAQAFVGAFQKGDANAVANLWTKEGEYVDENGDTVRGREALAKSYTGFFAKRKQLKAEAKSVAVRFLGNDTAVEDGIFTVHATDQPTQSNRYSTLYVRQDGRWLIALLKERNDEAVSEPKLADLGWLVGFWESEGPEAHAKITYEWDEAKKFLHARYTITPKKQDEKAKTGEEIIGIDPALHAIRGWTFDSQGSVGESFWTWDGDRWSIDSRGKHADGSLTTGVNLLTRHGDDTFTWRSVKRTLDGKELRDNPPVKVNRVRSKSVTTRG